MEGSNQKPATLATVAAGEKLANRVFKTQLHMGIHGIMIQLRRLEPLNMDEGTHHQSLAAGTHSTKTVSIELSCPMYPTSLRCTTSLHHGEKGLQRVCKLECGFGKWKITVMKMRHSTGPSVSRKDVQERVKRAVQMHGI